MVLKVDMSGLDRALQEMGGKESAVPQSLPPPQKEIQGLAQFEAELELRIDGLMIHEGRPTTLHIHEPHALREDLLSNTGGSPKFHITWCSKLDEMHDEGRGKRYIVNYQHNGKFSCRPKKEKWTWKWNDPILAELSVCQYCLRALNYQNFHANWEKRDQIVDNFVLAEFLKDRGCIFDEDNYYKLGEYPSGGYPPDWTKISFDKREQAGWKCQECQVYCGATKDRKLLHAHHKNGIPGDVRDENLVALCALCHAKQPKHGHMKVVPQVEARIRQLRGEQGRRSKPHDAEPPEPKNGAEPPEPKNGAEPPKPKNGAEPPKPKNGAEPPKPKNGAEPAIESKKRRVWKLLKKLLFWRARHKK